MYVIFKNKLVLYVVCKYINNMDTRITSSFKMAIAFEEGGKWYGGENFIISKF